LPIALAQPEAMVVAKRLCPGPKALVVNHLFK
jgi:hypothetical protein